MTSKFFAVAGDSSSDESEAEVQVKGTESFLIHRGGEAASVETH